MISLMGYADVKFCRRAAEQFDKINPEIAAAFRSVADSEEELARMGVD